jgi:PPK2 family polyphosphate:nucleotide phosphotransferase
MGSIDPSRGEFGREFGIAVRYHNAMIKTPYLADPGKKVKFDKLDPADTGDFKDRGQAEGKMEKNLERLSKLQEVLYAQSKHAVLIVLQAMDTAGKDGSIRHVFSGVNPQGCSVSSFKKPTDLELAHDFLWRIHDSAPRKGMIGIFNRSHYESVLVERVHNLVPKSVWHARYKYINQFEEMLASEGTTIIKFFLHISKDEQKQRLEARLSHPEKNWKFDHNDLSERQRWDDYMGAYEDAIEKCSTKHAPWYIVPANHKWFRNWVLSETIVKTLEELKMEYPEPPDGLENVKVT